MAEILRRILAVTNPERIILFGSRTARTPHPGSDYDLLIVESEPGDLREKRRRLRAALAGVEAPVDLVVMDAATFEKRKDYVGGIAHVASSGGRVVYVHA
ncbi:MAG: nucleotidyltransferase domain-containing protein [Deltaproteobacteria bacterium]|nr:nucleotidyltransferase domain-containing protein [Deltaproteobacteria bacterium]